MLLPFQGANGVVAFYPGCRSLWSLALGWEVLPFQGAGQCGVSCLHDFTMQSVLLVLFPLRSMLQMYFIGQILSAFSPLAGGVPVGRGSRGLREKEYRRKAERG